MSFRYSTKFFLLAVPLVAVCSAALILPSPMWAAGFYTAALLAICAALVAVILSRGETRAFWVGFALVSGAYLYMITVDERGLRGGLWEPKLVTSHLLVRAYEFIESLIPDRPVINNPYESGVMHSGVMVRGSSPFKIPEYMPHFIRVGNSLCAIALGYIGGVWGRRCYARWMHADADMPMD